MGRFLLGRYLVGLVVLLPLSAGAQSPDKDGAEVRRDREDEKTSADRAAPDTRALTELSRKEQGERVEKMLQDMRDALRRVTELLGDARSSKDIVQLNCVNEKLTQVKGLVRVSEESSGKMYDAMSANAADAVTHEITKVSVAHQKVSLLRAEAEQCVGEVSVYTGDTEVTVEVDNDIPERDPTVPLSPPPGPEVLEQASPY